MKKNKLNIDIVAFDAGGAELLSSIVQHEQENYYWRLIAPDDSPAWSIFNRKRLEKLINKNPDISSISNLWNNSTPDFLFAGTGLNGIEWPFIKEAKKNGIISISFLDHWINFRERFGYSKPNWESNKPDFFALSDNKAYVLAKKLNLGRLLKIKNYYIEDLLTELNSLKLSENSRLLFISEAIEEHCLATYGDASYKGYTQTGVLAEILDNFDIISDKLHNTGITIRLHPAEAYDKFDYMIKKYPDIDIEIEKPSDLPLNESILKSKAVIGINSMALLIAYLLKKPTVSYIPETAECCLPLPKECIINNLLDVSNIDNISIYDNNSELAFHEQYPLIKMINVLMAEKPEVN